MNNISNINFIYAIISVILRIVWFCARERVQNRHHNTGCKAVQDSLKFVNSMQQHARRKQEHG